MALIASMISVSTMAAEGHTCIPRAKKTVLKRMDWDTRLKSLTDKKFQRRYRIDKEGFDILLADIKQYLPRVRRGGVCNELKLAMTLRWLAGGSYLDIAGAQAPLPVRSQSVYTQCVSQGIHADLHGVSEDTMYRHVWKIIRAIDRKFKLPLINQLNNVHLPSSGTDRSDVETVAQGFDEKTHGVMSGCIGAVDGIAIKLDARTLADVDSKAAHWCRKGFYSLNYQVVADSNRRITWASAKFCGSTHDSVALDQTELGKILTDPTHPINKTNYWLAGDDAYKGVAGKSDSLLTPHPVGRGYTEQMDAFNFYQSMLRIDVECTFGAVIHRWGILQRKLSVDNLFRVTKLLSVICKLHNICMERNLPDHVGRVMSDSYGEKTRGGDMWGGDWATHRLPDEPDSDDEDAVPLRAASKYKKQRLRDELTSKLERFSMSRPRHSTYRPMRRQRTMQG
jgi:hypothetical protein